MTTADDGPYGFETVYPAPYLNGTAYRPSHLHFIIHYPDQPLVTRLCFQGDAHLDGDPGSSDPTTANRIIPLEEREGKLHGVFAINGQTGSSGALPRQTLRALRERCGIRVLDWGESLEFRFLNHAGPVRMLEVFMENGSLAAARKMPGAILRMERAGVLYLTCALVRRDRPARFPGVLV